ncbi:hypothetical protein C943_01871 [Mariniradius saccharolyticus AK6]|uniref:DUF3857 domain-containing protein n=2 Tax=Mariniradius TaxID=1245590 RepID=M7X269_9BACT|nr:hypothetical protein C943_01871 [Mariniradius saccharolyticus AK6]
MVMFRLCSVFTIWLAIGLVSVGNCQNFSISGIPQEYLGASAVIRESAQEVRVDKTGKFFQKNRTVATIFKKDAEDLAVLAVDYNSLIKVKSISANAYDIVGKQIFKSKASDIKDYSNFSSFSVYEDTRVKLIDATRTEFPYTVELEYELEIGTLFYIPNWVPQATPKYPVMSTRGSYTFFPDNPIRFFAKNIEGEGTSSTTADGMTKVVWELANLPAYDPEPLVPVAESELKVLFAAPTYFDFDGFKGDLKSWENMGSWIYQLNKGKDVLTDATKQDVAKAISGLGTDQEKVRALYHYLQGKTRYVSIQLGLGGLMPFDALTVDKYGYGDCKALSNYMGALLKEAGIKSHYALIYGGEGRRILVEDFPKSYFNHAILAVPMEKDTIWLECTSQSNPFGYLGNFTSDRQALLVTEAGGKLVRTPKYSHSQNAMTQKAIFKIEESGNAQGSLELEVRATQAENGGVIDVVRSSSDTKKKWIQQYFGLPSLEVVSYEFGLEDAPIPVVIVKSDLIVKNMAGKSGNRFFLQPNQLNVYSTNLPAAKDGRKGRFERKMGFVDVDEIVYAWPEGFEVENLPKEISIDSEFGVYRAEFLVEGNQLTYKRNFELRDGVYEASQYQPYRDFLSKVERSDKTKVVLKKSQ